MSHAQQIIDNLPDAAKRNVLYSLVGSLNASIIGTASSVSTRLTRHMHEANPHRDHEEDDGYFIELEPREVVKLLNEMDDRADLLLNVRRTVRVAQQFRDQLIALSNIKNDGSIESTMEFMLDGKAKPFDKALMKVIMKEAEMDIDPALMESMNQLDAAQRATKLAAQRGAVEWLIERVFTSYGDDKLIDTEHGAYIAHAPDTGDFLEVLSDDTLGRLYDKIVSAIDRARTAAVMGILRGDRRFTLSDVTLLTASYKEARALSNDHEARTHETH